MLPTKFFVAYSLISLVTSSTYDYVIIGGGTAGLTIANRLSKHFSVAVIEAGGYYEEAPLPPSIPGLDLVGVGTNPGPVDTDAVDWNFVTEPQAGADGRQLHYARGKCLGGR